MDNLKITENLSNNDSKKDYTISITTVHKNNNNNKLIDKNIRLQKKLGNKKGTFSPRGKQRIINHKTKRNFKLS